MTTETPRVEVPGLYEFKLTYPDGRDETWLPRVGADPRSLVATAKLMLDLAGATYTVKWPAEVAPETETDEKAARSRPSGDESRDAPRPEDRSTELAPGTKSVTAKTADSTSKSVGRSTRAPKAPRRRGTK